MKRKLPIFLVLALLCLPWTGFGHNASLNRTLNVAFQVSGKVMDENGSPLPGVNILEKGETNGTVTDSEGKYSLTVASSSSTLVFSFIGYKTEERVLNGQSTVNITLSPDVSALEEIVVVGYGAQKKSSLVASISTVTSKEITALPVPNMEQALQGRAPGVLVVNNGAPGEAPLVRIRGINSINYASNPLYVVDGIVQVGNFNLFNSRDIESIEVLKDANSAAMFGSRAAAGVVLVTTKKGSRDGFHVSVDSYYGVQKAWRTLDLLNRDEYLKYGNDLLSNAGAAMAPRFSNMNEAIYAGSDQTFATTDTDWQDEMFRSAPISQTDVSVSGGNDKSRFFISGGYFNQDGIMLGTSFKRYTFRLNSEHQLSKRFTLGQTLMVGKGTQASEQNPGGRSQIQNMIRMTPYIPVYNPMNLGGFGGTTGADASDPQNPVRAALQDLSRNENVRILGTVYFEADLFAGLKFRSNVGLDFNTQRSYGYTPRYTEGFNTRPRTGITDGRTNFTSPIFTNQLTFDKTVGKHYVNAVAAIEYQTFSSVTTTASGNTLSLVAKELASLENKAFTADKSESAIYSYIGRVNYQYANRYILSGTVRRDGASNWGPGHKFGTFPSFGVGWIVSEEGFMSTVSAVSELKLRASYGKIGNAPPGSYPWQTVIFGTGTQYPIGGQLQNGAYYNKLPNLDLEWELTKITNVGVDLGLMQNRITFSAEVYERNTDNLILDVFAPPSTGYPVATQTNVGKMRNRGLELQAGYTSTASSPVKWNVNGNIGFISNNVKSLESEKAYILAGTNADFGGFPITRTEAGYAVQSFYGWVTDGLFQSVNEIIGADGKPAAAVQNLPLNPDGTVDLAKYNDPENKGKYTRPGDIRFKDLDNDGVIGDNDRKFLGSFLPKFTYGLNLSANYKGFDMTLFFQGVQGNKIYNGTKVTEQGMLRLFNSSKDVLEAWTPDNTDTDVPRAVSGDPNNNSRTSDRFIEDGSYLRLKNLSIGYTIPKATLESLTGNVVQNFRVYLSSQNLFTITKYTGYDPEIGSRFNGALTAGIDYGQFPQARTLLVGVQLGF